MSPILAVSAIGIGASSAGTLDARRCLGGRCGFETLGADARRWGLLRKGDDVLLYLDHGEGLDLDLFLLVLVVVILGFGLDLFDLGEGRHRRRGLFRHGRRRRGDQFVAELLDQTFQDAEVVRHLVALIARLAFEIGAQILDLGMHLLELLRELVEPGQTAGPLAHADIVHGPVEALDAVGEEIDPGHVVLDPVDALQVLVDDFERRLELVQAVARGTGGPAAARHHKIRGRHHHVERPGGDQRRNLGDTGMKDQPYRERRRRDRHGEQDDHVEHGKPSRGIAPP